MCKRNGMSQIITREYARHNGLNKYFTGKPCKNGHLAERYTMSGTCQECISASREIMIAPGTTVLEPIPNLPTGEIITVSSQRLELQQRRMELEQQKIVLRAQKQALAAQRAEFQIVINQDRIERRQRRERKEAIQEKLQELNVLFDSLDRDAILLMVWAFAAQRDPRFKMEDVIVRQIDQARIRVRCFPQDVETIVRETNRMYSARTAPVVQQDRQRIQESLQLAAESESNWPEGDPR
jgi:hypothetical protein